MRLPIAITTLASAAIVALTSPAADAPSAAKVVAPYLDEQTVAVAHVNLAAVDFNAAVQRAAKLVHVNAEQLTEPLQPARDRLAALRKAGAHDLYAVLSVADIPDPGPFVLVPRGEANGDELKQALQGLGCQVVEPLDGAMFGGAKSTLDRLRGLKPAARQDLDAAFAAVQDATIQVAIVPSDEQRRIVAEGVPSLPPQMGGGPGTILSKGVRWAAIGVTTQPTLSVRLISQAEDAAAAKALVDAVDRGLSWAAKQEDVRRMFPQIGEIVRQSPVKVDGSRVTLTVDEANPGVAQAAAAAATQARSAAGRSQSANNLKQIALSWHNFLDANKGHFPDDIKSKDGKPLLSWRVAVLPYLSENDLYKQFRLDERWDSEHNKALIAKMPAVFRAPAQKAAGDKTTYLVPTGTADKAHIGVLGARIRDITDGTSNTILAVEANDESAVVWTKPDDLVVDVKDPLKGLIGHYEQGFLAALADGSVRLVSKSVKPATLIAAFTRDGGEPLGNDW
jgi:hypothetical protein